MVINTRLGLVFNVIARRFLSRFSGLRKTEPKQSAGICAKKIASLKGARNDFNSKINSLNNIKLFRFTMKVTIQYCTV